LILEEEGNIIRNEENEDKDTNIGIEYNTLSLSPILFLPDIVKVGQIVQMHVVFCVLC
jgi:hypothetical protein